MIPPLDTSTAGRGSPGYWGAGNQQAEFEREVNGLVSMIVLFEEFHGHQQGVPHLTLVGLQWAF